MPLIRRIIMAIVIVVLLVMLVYKMCIISLPTETFRTSNNNSNQESLSQLNNFLLSRKHTYDKDSTYHWDQPLWVDNHVYVNSIQDVFVQDKSVYQHLEDQNNALGEQCGEHYTDLRQKVNDQWNKVQSTISGQHNALNNARKAFSYFKSKEYALIDIKDFLNKTIKLNCNLRVGNRLHIIRYNHSIVSFTRGTRFGYSGFNFTLDNVKNNRVLALSCSDYRMFRNSHNYSSTAGILFKSDWAPFSSMHRKGWKVYTSLTWKPPPMRNRKQWYYNDYDDSDWQDVVPSSDYQIGTSYGTANTS